MKFGRSIARLAAPALLADAPPKVAGEREFNVLTALARAIPPVPGAGRVCNAIARFYLRKPRGVRQVHALGAEFVVDPADSMTQRELAFMPQLHERAELSVLRKVLTPGATFVDAGAHVGTYAILASKLVGPTGRVCALEAYAPTFHRLQENLVLNGAGNVAARCIGVSDRTETLCMQTNPSNSAGNRLASGGGPPVRCRALGDILNELGFGALTALKLDVEGLERRVVAGYFATMPVARWPRYVFVETNAIKDIDGSAVPVLQGYGYVVMRRSKLCHVLERVPRGDTVVPLTTP